MTGEQGGCHCGAIKIRLSFNPVEATECNCSICRRTGALWTYGSPDEIEVSGTGVGYVQGDATLTNWHCGTCGIITHWTPVNPEYGRMGVNLRIFATELWENLPQKLVDRANW